MLVNLDRFGRLGNRLFLDAHLSAFCWKHGITLRNAAIDPYAPSFPSLAALVSPSWGLSARALLPWSRHFRYWGETDLDFDQADVSELVGPLLAGETVFFHGWLFRGFRSVEQFRGKIVEKYQPVADIEAWAQERIRQGRERGDLVVAVHIRWEDYRGSSHFLELAEYRLRMEAVAAALAPRKVAFLVFSNENVPETDIGNLNVLFAKGTPVQDLSAMACCDYIMAPPSTFSGWASFYGRVPLLTLKRDQKVSFKDFAVVRG